MDEKLTLEQKREKRFERWLDAKEVEFKNPEAKKAYQQRVTRFSIPTKSSQAGRFAAPSCETPG